MLPHVLIPSGSRFEARLENRASFPAPAAPRPADPADDRAPKMSARLLDAYGANDHDVQRHAGNRNAA